MENTLSLPEQLLLLCLNDETGRCEEAWLRQGLEGALLAELMLQERVGLEEGNRLVVLDPAPTGDELLDRAVERIAGHRQPRPAGEWIGKLIPNNMHPSEPVLTDTLSKRLVQRGILTQKDEKFLWVFPFPTYPTQDGAPEGSLREQLRAALLGDGPVDQRLTVLIALLKAAHALDRVLTPEEAEKAGPRVAALCEAAAAGQGSGGAVTHAVGAEQARSNTSAWSSVGDLIGIIGPFFV